MKISAIIFLKTSHKTHLSIEQTSFVDISDISSSNEAGVD